MLEMEQAAPGEHTREPILDRQLAHVDLQPAMPREALAGELDHRRRAVDPRYRKAVIDQIAPDGLSAAAAEIENRPAAR